MLLKNRLAGKVNFPTPEEEKVFWNLKRYGAPLTRHGSAGLDLTLEETLVLALSLSRRFPFVANVWPVLFSLNEDHVDTDLLERLARDAGQGRTLGFFFSVLMGLTGQSKYEELQQHLADTRGDRTDKFFLLDEGVFEAELAERRASPEARRWNFRMLTTLEGFRETFDTFVGRDEKV